LYFSRDYTTHDFRFLKSLSESEHQVFFLRLERKNRQLEDRPLPEGITQVQWAGGQREARIRDGLRLWFDLKRVIRKVKPDVIHAGPIQTTAFLAALTGFKPLVSMSWGSDLLKDADRNLFYRCVTRFTLKRTTVLIGDCEAVRKKAVSLGFPAKNVMLFPWGIDLNRFVPGKNENFRERRGWSENFVLLSLRAWEPIYGVDVLAKAFVIAARQVPDLRLILLGGGSQAPLIRFIFEQNQLSDRVFFGGQIPQKELPAYYQAADVYLSASHSDGSSVSLMEALGSGLPVLISDIPGNKEWVQENRHGWLFRDGDAADLAEKMVLAYYRRQALPEMGQTARQLAESRADWQQNFQKLLSAYRLAVKLNKR
jgi:glycosyltransferase involved in cell wall biosynthesis